MKRFNLFDAAVAVFVIALIPIAYGTYLLFRTPKPVVTSVKRVDITREERRIGGPSLVAKMKIQGSGLRPMLRAFIDDAPAIGFVFENPNSADLLVGAVAPGSHDLVLFDGVQEVARVPKAIRLQAAVTRTATVRVRLTSPPEVVALIRNGDHDWSAHSNRAVVTDVTKELMTVQLGADAVDAGWQYFTQDLKAGADFVLTTDTYIAKGVVLNVVMGAAR